MKSIKLLTASLILMAATSSSAFKCWSWKFGCGKGTPKAISACLASHSGKNLNEYGAKLLRFWKEHPKCRKKARGQEIDVCIDYTKDMLPKDLHAKKWGFSKAILRTIIEMYGRCLVTLKLHNEDEKFLHDAAVKFIETKKLTTSVSGKKLIHKDDTKELVKLLDEVFKRGSLSHEEVKGHFKHRRYSS